MYLTNLSKLNNGSFHDAFDSFFNFPNARKAPTSEIGNFLGKAYHILNQ